MPTHPSSALPQQSKAAGFTVIELIAAACLVGLVGIVIGLQKNDNDASSRDSERKTAINAIYYALEESYFAVNKAYPLMITTDTLSGITADTLNDPQGLPVGSGSSSLRYEPRDCNETTCRSYVLRADLEKEPDFIRTSSNGAT